MDSEAKQTLDTVILEWRKRLDISAMYKNRCLDNVSKRPNKTVCAETEVDFLGWLDGVAAMNVPDHTEFTDIVQRSYKPRSRAVRMQQLAFIR